MQIFSSAVASPWPVQKRIIVAQDSEAVMGQGVKQGKLAFGRHRGFLRAGGAELAQQGVEEPHAALGQVGVQAGLDLLHILAHKAQARWQHPLKELPNVS